MPVERSTKRLLHRHLASIFLTIEASPLCKLWQARCVATMLDEQAVSTCIFGPLRSKNHPSLLANSAGDVPVVICVGASSGTLTVIFR